MKSVFRKQVVIAAIAALAIPVFFSGCKSNSKELVKAVAENNVDAILGSLAKGDNPDSKSTSRQTVLNMAIDNIAKYKQERDTLFTQELEKVDNTRLGKQIGGSLHYYHRETKRKTNSTYSAKGFSAIGKALGASEVALAKYLLYADLKTAYDKDPATIKQEILKVYNKKRTKSTTQAELRNITRVLVGDKEDPLGKAVKNYIIAEKTVGWLVQCGADMEIANTDGTAPADRLTKLSLYKYGEQLKKSSARKKKDTKQARKSMKETKELIAKDPRRYFMDK